MTKDELKHVERIRAEIKHRQGDKEAAQKRIKKNREEIKVSERRIRELRLQISQIRKTAKSRRRPRTQAVAA